MGDKEFGSRSSQTDDLEDLYWLAQSQDNVTDSDAGSLYRQPDFSMGQHYKEAMICTLS